MIKLTDYNKQRAEKFNNPLETLENRLSKTIELRKKRINVPELNLELDREAKREIEEFRELYDMAIEFPIIFRAIREKPEDVMYSSAKREDAHPLLKKYGDLSGKYLRDVEEIYREQNEKSVGTQFSNVMATIATDYRVFINEECQNHVPRRTPVAVKFAAEGDTASDERLTTNTTKNPAATPLKPSIGKFPSN